MYKHDWPGKKTSAEWTRTNDSSRTSEYGNNWNNARQATRWSDDKWPSHRFCGKRVNVVQIGLGTCCTFVQNLGGEPDDSDFSIQWLLDACSERRPERVCGVAVEPMPEHLDRLRTPARRLPAMELVQVAIGGDEAEKELYCLTSATYEALLRRVPRWQRKAFEADLLYVRNMSCVGTVHPMLEDLNQGFSSTYGVRVPTELMRIKVWTYDRLAKELDFCGCEVLLIDAEGYDTEILRSMAAHCEQQAKEGREAWPDVVQFETMGHCDLREGTGAEAQIVKQLEVSGYLLLYWSYHNTILIRRKALRPQFDKKRAQRLKRWIQTFRCKGCYQKKQTFPFTMDAGKLYCWRCYSVWRQTV